MQDKNRRNWMVAATVLALVGAAKAQAPKPPATLLIVGDSMSAEYGLARASGWVALLEQRLAAEKIHARVINASISGDTSAGGRARLAALLAQHQPTHVLIELGGNDALRGLPLQNTEDNLSAMTAQAQAAKARVLLVGMQVPPNYGSAYTQRFSALFARVAQKHRAALVPFLLEGVANASDPTALFQADRIHPNAQAQPQMLANVWPHLRPLLR